jgi:hypothetical protein
MRLIFIFILLISLGSCKKDPIKYNLSGNTINTNSNSPISNINLKFYQTEVNTNALNPNFVFIGETNTNSNGEYNFSFDRERILELKIELRVDGYYYFESIINSSELTTGTDNIFNFELESKAWIKVRLYNSFVEDGEQLNFYKHNVKEECEDCCINSYTIVTQDTPDTTFTCPVVGDLYSKYSYGEVVENTSFTDSIYCIKNDTTELFITY